ncbi:MAG: hypothetical protein AB7H93_04455 [Vicinamibacterales bacterium]
MRVFRPMSSGAQPSSSIIATTDASLQRRRRHPIDASPSADEPLDVGGRGRLSEMEQRDLVLGRGDPGQCPHLGVGDRPRAMVALTSGSPASALATRSFSPAAPSEMPVRQCNQWALVANLPSPSWSTSAATDRAPR